jgi:hypothetical protein
MAYGIVDVPSTGNSAIANLLPFFRQLPPIRRCCLGRMVGLFRTVHGKLFVADECPEIYWLLSLVI